MRHPTRSVLLAACSLTALLWLSWAHADDSYRLLQTYHFAAAPGSSSEYFDYVTVDPTARRVYLSRGTAVQIIDADSGASIGTVTGFKREHGVAVAPELGRGFITDGSLATITVFDLKTLQRLATVKTDPDADCMVYDPATQRALSMNGDGNSSSVVDAKSGKLIRTIALGGAPEFAVADANGTVFANLADKDQIIAIDTRSLQIKARWATAPEGEPTALAIDREHHRLFSAGRKPQQLIVMDADNGHIVQSFPISAGTDAVAFDPETGNVFVSTREGKLHVFHEDSPNSFSDVGTVTTEFGAKTMGLDAKTHRVFLDTADFSAAKTSASGAQ